MMKINCTVNGEAVEVEVKENKTLLRMLREDLHLSGTKEGCGIGECGACTVIMNGQAVNSCLVLAAECNEAVIETVEGESKNGKLSRMQQAFIKHQAFQCGFCTPGILMSLKAFLKENPKPTDDEIKEAIAGNLCRCTGYQTVLDAVKEIVNSK